MLLISSVRHMIDGVPVASLLIFTCLFCCNIISASAQQKSGLPRDTQPVATSLVGNVDRGDKSVGQRTAPTELPTEPTRITTELLDRQVYSGINQKIHSLRQKTQGRSPSQIRDSNTPSQVGDTRSFEARNILNQSEWRIVKSRLVYRSERVLIWVSTSEYDLLVENDRLAPIVHALSLRLEERLPDDAIETNLGILEIADEYLGRPPDVDGDGRVDILLLDIRDGFSQTGSYVAGYFDPVHLTEEPHSNRRDMLFVDTRPTLVFEDSLRTEEAAATVAHEYQHLIHAGYEGDERENTFVNEGLSEVTEIMCGFPPRPADAYFREPGRSLFSWNYSAPLPDYARASLFAHYLFDRIGYRNAHRLVQSDLVGREGVESVLRSIGEWQFETLFRDWGRALFSSSPTPASVSDYRDPSRQDVRFDDFTAVNDLPSVSTLRLPPLSHAPIRFPLVERVSFETQEYGDGPSDIRFSGRTSYPDGGGRFVANLRSTEIEANDRRHGTVELLASNIAPRPAGDSIQSVEMSILTQGTRSETRRERSYDDGIADAYSGSASYLLLPSSDQSVGLTFGPASTDWLFGVSVKVLFSSEVEGTGVPPEAPREITLRIRELQNGRPGSPVTPPITRRLHRPFANPRVTFVSLQTWYDELSTMRDSFVVTLRSARTANPIAVALDKTEESIRDEAGSAFYTQGNRWTPIRNVRAEGTRLHGYRPILRAHVAVPKQTLPSNRLQADIKHNLKRVFVRLDASFPLQANQTRVAAKLPSGHFVNGQLLDHFPKEYAESDTTGVVFAFPLQGGRYTIHANAEVANVELTTVQNTFRWEPIIEDGIEMGHWYPNPVGGHTPARVRLVLLDDARVSMSLYDVLGRRVQEAVKGRSLSSGTHRLRVQTDQLASGTYFARVMVRRERDGRTSTVTRRLDVTR